VVVPHIAFQIMVGIGMLLLAVALAYVYLMRRGPLPRPMLLLLAACTPLGFVAIEAGWTVTEVGRQPWIATGVMRTAEALTPVPGMRYHLASFTVLYLGLGAMCVWLFVRQIQAAHRAVQR
jgi:cytochrome d ubiquinol oxidase subunit I